MITITFYFLCHLVPMGQGYDAEIMSKHTTKKACEQAQGKVTTIETACVKITIKRGE